MPTVFSHPAVPIAIGLGLGRKVIPTRLIIVGIVLSILPDLDVLAFRFGISYSSDVGHRGFSHSLTFAAVTALLGASLFRDGFTKAFWFLFAASASHGIYDAFTNGGLGIAHFWPLSAERFFAPIQPIEVSPLSLARFLSQRGVAVLVSEIWWVWLPCLAVGCFFAYVRKRSIKGKERKYGSA